MSGNRGTIYTFYSFKGGVGRTMALANTSVMLSRWGYRTLIVDFDLEAPGLETFFADRTDVASAATSDGVIDLMTAGFKNLPGKEWSRGLLSVRVPGQRAQLDLLTAGRRESLDDYYARVRTFDSHDFYEKGGGDRIEELRCTWTEVYDFVLIDSRTGITEIGGICTAHLADALVIVFTATEQSFRGAVDVARRAREARQKLPYDRLQLITLPVPSRFDTSEEYRISQDWLDRFATGLTEEYEYWLPAQTDRRAFLERTKLPYQSYFSFGETLPVLEQGSGDPAGLAYAYETIGALLAHRLEGPAEILINRDEYVRRAANRSLESDSPVPEVPPPGDLEDLLASHERWIRSGGREGKLLDLRGANLRGAPLAHRDLRESCLRDADLTEADLTETNFASADLSGAVLRGASANGVRLRGADLRTSFMRGAVLQNGDLRSADLSGAVLSGAMLTNANLEDARLGGARLEEAVAQGCRLRGADLRLAALADADFRGADLRDADLSTASGLTSEQLGGANLAGSHLPSSVGEFPELGPISAVMRLVHGAVWVLALLSAIGTWWVLTAGPEDLFQEPYLYLVGAGLITINFLALNIGFAKAWERTTKLPRVFIDQDSVAKKVAPWLPATLQAALSRHGGWVQSAPEEVVRLVAWWAAPISAAILWVRYVLISDTSMAIAMACLVAVGVGVGVSTLRWASHATAAYDRRIPTRAALFVSALLIFGTGVALTTASWVAAALTSDVSAQLRGHGDVVAHIDYSPDGLLLVTASWDGTARVWDIAREETVAGPLQHQDRVMEARFSPDGKRIVTASRDGTAQVWDAATGQPIGELMRHQAPVRSARFSPDGRRVLTSSADSTGRVWDVETGLAIGEPLRHAGPVLAATFGSDGHLIVTGSGDGTARVWDAATGRPIGDPMKHEGPVNHAVFGPGDRSLLTASTSDGTVRLWDVDAGHDLAGAPLATFEHPLVVGALWSPDAGTVWSVGLEGSLGRWNMESRQGGILRGPVDDPWFRGFVTTVEISPDATLFLTGGLGGVVYLWDAATGEELQTFLAHRSGVVALAFSPDGRSFTTTGTDGAARVWAVPRRTDPPHLD